ncbi:MAG: membrane protein [Phycisphaerae bacterium]|nr:MAG: membrane protein [Phycisphaerae bacterium]
MLIAVLLTLMLMFTATLSLALRLSSRVRMRESLERRGKGHLMDRLVKLRIELAHSVAAVRTACTLALALVMLRFFQTSGIVEAYWHYVLAFVCAFSLVIIFGVAIPSAWSRYAGESMLAVLLPVLMAMRHLFFPIVAALRVVDGLVRRLAGVPADSFEEETARHERELLAAVSEGEKLGAVDEEEKEMIESVMDLSDASVASIMTPRTEISAVEKSATFTELKDLIKTIGHSRIPVYEETIDSILGVVYAKDLLQIHPDDNWVLNDVMRPAPFIPETKNVRELLHEFQTQKVHMAIVLDEYGGTAGLVTIEDILEELVGEIVDEYDQDEPEPITRIDNDTLEIDARVRIDEINEELDIELPESESYDTIGGFVFSTMGRIPETGDSCQHENVNIRIILAEPRRIKRLRLHVSRNGEHSDN